MQSKHPSDNGTLFMDDAARRASAEAVLWQAIGTLFRWRRFVIGVTATMAVVAVVLSLLMPNWYRASARLLVPESSGGLSSLLLRNLPSAASSLFGGGGDYTRYLAILTSRSVQEAAVDTFGLVQVYELEDAKTPREDAIRMLADNVAFEIDEEYEFLSVAVEDLDPQRAADMANFFVRKLNEVNARLSSQSAGNYRRYIEQRYHEALADVDSLLDATQRFQERYGIFDLPAQTEGFFEQVGQMRAQAVEAEIQYDVALSQYGADNPQVVMLREMARSANQKYREALAGQEALLPVAKADVPEVARQYAKLELERTIQAAILEIVGPLYEQARFQEEQEVEAVQVLDQATPPVRKSRPKRSVIVVLATFSAFVLSVLFVLVFEWWRRHHARLALRLQQAIAAEQAPTHVSP